ncbi:unnamed protein product, partial [Mesorhabditis spiculigera]
MNLRLGLSTKRLLDSSMLYSRQLNYSMEAQPNLAKICSGTDIKPILVFLGGGQMATALVEGAVAKGFVTKEQVAVTARTEQTVKKWINRGYPNVSVDNKAFVEKYKSGIFFLAMKPQSRHGLYASGCDFTDCRVVCLMAGIDLKTLNEELPGATQTRLMRLHPNVAAAVGASTSILSTPAGCCPEQEKIVRAFANCSGSCFDVEENKYDAAGTIVGCSPAWVFSMIEALSDGGVLAGVPRDVASKLAAQAVMGAAKLVVETGEHPGVLKDKVCSAGGTTIAGVRVLEAKGMRSGFIEAVKAATDRAGELGKK